MKSLLWSLMKMKNEEEGRQEWKSSRRSHSVSDFIYLLF